MTTASASCIFEGTALSLGAGTPHSATLLPCLLTHQTHDSLYHKPSVECFEHLMYEFLGLLIHNQ